MITTDMMLDGVSLTAGAFLLFSPWLFGFAAEPASPGAAGSPAR
jgi:hypothetical protein